jgi:hypothetical protein
MEGDRREFLFNFSLLGPSQWDVNALFAALYVQHKGLGEVFFGGTPQRLSPPHLELQRNYYFFCKLPFLTWTEVKSPSGLARCVRRGEKILRAPKLLFFCVHPEIAARSTAKSSKSILSK